MGDHYEYYNQNQDRKINKVYINPNFNKPDNVPTSSSNMYFNPNFLHVTSDTYHHNIQEPKDQASKTRIHVNPNFIRNAHAFNQTDANKSQPYGAKSELSAPSFSINSTCKGLNQDTKDSQLQMPFTKSRYCLVRQKENLISKNPTSKQVTNTVRVNKYKSVSLNVVKNNLATFKPPQNARYKTSSKAVLANNNTRFKFVKSNSATVLNQSETKHVGVRSSSVLNKSLLKTASRKINDRLVLKKNNIPCPLFKKYGKCLRKVRGNCEYLHDKKHVSICRKFLKGICHDKDCLLSHDLTDKKMPTCYFYLQGACTKEFCPYLHVKLNDKIKICQHFLRGYCENGDKCLFRHTNICGDAGTKEVCSKKKLTYSPADKMNSAVKVKSRKKSLVIIPSHSRNSRKKVENGYNMDQRYFKEFVEDKKSGETSDSIKPSRIKLGTLPSFIQL